MRFVKLREVFPGDKIEEKLTKSLGIHKDRAYVHGVLCRVSNHLFVMSKTKRYTPFIDDLVIGRIQYVSGDFYRVDLGTTTGILPSLAFTNASKRNKPELKKDDYVFCKVEKVGVEPLLSCVGEGFGLIEGYVFGIEVWRSQWLYMSNRLFEVGQRYKFKMAVGVNGFVSIVGDNPESVREIYELINSNK
ncbi:putative exosome complex component rrp40 [Nosema granulosis]|uniref:Exosome complex component rrp40 n=1 Tax=Nosema granulosis TaxID=83296 RepID=A0A9P6H219_9MICR|nr:putative exosome complex component rrp40 [Nosema granulosis]